MALPTAPYLTALHVLHVEAVLALFALFVLLLLAAALFDYAEAAGDHQQRGHHGDGNQRPWRNCQMQYKDQSRTLSFF